MDTDTTPPVVCYYVHQREADGVASDVLISNDEEWLDSGQLSDPQRSLDAFQRRTDNGHENLGKTITFRFDLIAITHYLLTLQEEATDAEHDEKQRLDLEQRTHHAGGLVQVPLVDKAADLLRRHLSLGEESPVWPDGKAFCVVLSHDIDTWSRYDCSLVSGAIALQRALRYRRLNLSFAYYWRKALFSRKDVSAGEYGLKYAKEIMSFEMSLGIRSTWFLFAAPWRGWYWDLLYDVRLDRSMRKLVETLLGEEFEVGLHSSMASAFKPELLHNETALLESVIKPHGGNCYGVRQHV